MAGVPDTTMTIYGAGHLAGKTAQIVICGVDAGTALVAADGSVVFTYGSDPGGIITPAYVVAHPTEVTDHDVAFTIFDGSSYTVVTIPVLVGLTYTCKGQMMRPLGEKQLGAGQGEGLGKTRRVAWGALLTRDLLALQVGTSFTNLSNANLTTDGGLTKELAIAADAPYTGVFVSVIDDNATFDGQFAWQSSKPYNVVIGAAASFVEGADR